MAKAKADGYTVLIHHIGMSTAPSLYRKLAYNPMTDFEMIGLINEVPMTIVARKDFPANNMKDFIATVKKDAKKWNLANAGLGAASHLCGMLFQSYVGVDLTTVPYKGTASAMNDLMGGQIDLLCDQTSGTVPLIKASRIRAIAAAGPQSIASMPDMPAISEAGVSGVDINISFGLYAPKGTPKAEIDKLSQALQAAVVDTEVKSKLDAMGVAAVGPELARPEALRAHLRKEIDVLGGLLIKAGVKPE